MQSVIRSSGSERHHSPKIGFLRSAGTQPLFRLRPASRRSVTAQQILQRFLFAHSQRLSDCQIANLRKMMLRHRHWEWQVSGNCPVSRPRVPDYYNYGISEGAISKTTFAGFPAVRLTFQMFSTNVPSEADAVIKDITCVTLKVTRGYSLTSYYSEPVRVSAEPSAGRTR